MNEFYKKNESKDIKELKKFLDRLGFICTSYPSAQNLIYSKNEDIVIIKR